MAPKNTEKMYEATTSTDLTPEEIFEADNPICMESVLEELCGHYGRCSEVVMEYIDNDASNIVKYGIKGHIQVYIENNEGKTVSIRIRDNGTGIKNIKAALSLGDTTAAETAGNDHNFGLKNCSIITSNHVLMTDLGNGTAYIVRGPIVERVKVEKHKCIPGLKRGTEVRFDLDYKFLQADNKRWGEYTGAGSVQNFFTLVECLVETIGLVHGRRMKEYGYKITVTAVDKAKKEVYAVKPLAWTMKSFYAVDPTLGVKRKTEGVSYFPSFDGDGEFPVDYWFGNVTAARTRLGYLKKNQVSQGIYFFINWRYIGRTSTLCLERGTHPALNGMVGIVNMRLDRASQGPKTCVAKTGFVQSSPDYNRLLDLTYGLVPNLSYIINRELNSGLKELKVTKAWASKLAKMGHNVEHQPRVPGITDEKSDILDFTDKILYEVKLGALTVAGVRQIQSYVSAYLAEMEGNLPFEHAYICATSCPSEAERALEHANYILGFHGIKIEYRDLHELAGDVIKELKAEQQ